MSRECTRSARQVERIGAIGRAAMLTIALSCVASAPGKHSDGAGGAPAVAAAVMPGEEHPPSNSEKARSFRIRAALGEAAFASLVEAKTGYAAALRVIAVERAQQQALRGTDSIAGYPATSPLRPIAPAILERIVQSLGGDEKYVFNRRVRCANRELLGIRFAGTVPLELAIGVPCNQAIWAVNGKWAVLVLSGQAVASIRELLTVSPGGVP